MYQIVLKAPHDITGIYIDYKQTTWSSLICINDWINNIFETHKINKIFYNDEVPGKTTDSSHAHAKGILLWDNMTIKWLIHSVPKWPEIGTDMTLPHSAIIYGQSFILLELPIRMLSNIMNHLQIMHVNIYVNNCLPDIFKLILKTDLDIFDMSETISHIAKSSKWNKDLFDDELANIFGGSILAETWMRPVKKDTQNVDNIELIKWPDGTCYSETHDHSKYAMSTNSEKPFVYIGDINHMSSQIHRGGGGVIIKDLHLWEAFYGLIFKR